MTREEITQGQEGLTLGFLGCGNMGRAILNGLLSGTSTEIPNRFILCTRSESSAAKLLHDFSNHQQKISIFTGQNLAAVDHSDVLILGCKPYMVRDLLSEPGIREALQGKLLISIAAGWTRGQLEALLYGSETTIDNASERCWISRAMPNVASSVSQSATTIEVSEPVLPKHYSSTVDAIFNTVGSIYHLPSSQMDVCTALGGSTPAFFAIICDALLDGAVAVGMPRQQAKDMTFQSLRGTADLLQSGESPTGLKEKVTSPGGCTIGAIMMLEEAGLRGIMSKALRESTSIAALLGQGVANVNGTRTQR